MPRTPLMHRLLRAVRAAALEVQTEQLERLPEESRATRRDILCGAAMMSAGALLGLPPLRGLAASEPRIAVVGGGLAGLTAAYELEKRGVSVHVFEANTRLGGRCWTIRDTFDEGQIAEHGGEFIDTDHKPIRNLATALGLELGDLAAGEPKCAEPVYLFNGARYTLGDATRDFRPIYSVLRKQTNAIGPVFNYRRASVEARRLDAMTISDWVAQYVPGGRGSRFGQLVENAFVEENAAGAEEQSALNLVTVLGVDPRENFNLYYTASDQRFHVRGGNDQIPSRLAEKLHGGVATGMVLLAVAQRDARIQLSFAKDTAIIDLMFDRVIFAMPFAVMRVAVDFADARFRPLKQRAIRELGMGTSVKSHLQFRRRAWHDLGCNGEIRMPASDFQTTWDVTRDQPGECGILNFWSGGRQALVSGNADAAALARDCMQRAGTVIPGMAQLWNGRMTRDVWKPNPWSLGSYAYYPPRYQTTIYGIEREPEGNCFFAGEHTADDQNVGFMNSAVSTGQRAAAQVLKSLKG